ncbi:MAG: NlpC/P60 family protein [Bacteroidota bacterium]
MSKSQAYAIASLCCYLLFFNYTYGGGEKSVQAKINKAIRTAESYTGTPHVMGGTSKKGIDCSALMQISFASAGVKLPRVSRQQALVGQKINRKALRKGDLLFFKISGSRISHTGLVTRKIGSDIEFIHASSSQGVTKSRLDDRYWAKRFSHGRRVWKGYRPNKPEREERPIAQKPPKTKPKPIAEKETEAPLTVSEDLAFPLASVRYYGKKFFRKLSKRELTYMEMEIYARNGYIFPTPAAQDLFEQKEWYQAIAEKTRKRGKARGRMTLIEISNLKKIRKELDRR